MTQQEKLQSQLDVLRDLSPRFGGRTLDNVMQNIEATLKAISK